MAHHLGLREKMKHRKGIRSMSVFYSGRMAMKAATRV